MVTAIQPLQADPVSDLIKASEFLVFMMAECDLAYLDQIDPALETLCCTVEAISPIIADASMMCYLRNRISSSLAAYEAGDWGIASNQLKELSRKLATRQARIAKEILTGTIGTQAKKSARTHCEESRGVSVLFQGDDSKLFVQK